MKSILLSTRNKMHLIAGKDKTHCKSMKITAGGKNKNNA